MQFTITNSYKSMPQGIGFDLPEFAIFTGKNGSGKTHLLEAIASNYAQATNNGKKASKISHIGFNGLNPQIADEGSNETIVISARNFWNGTLQHIVQHYKQTYATLAKHSTIESLFEKYIHPTHGHNSRTDYILNLILKRSKKNLDEITEEDVIKYGDLFSIPEHQSENLFISQCALIFKSYASKKLRNDLDEFRAKKYPGKKIPYLSDDDFLDKFGPPPWDMVNTVLQRAGLPYEINDPNDGEPDMPYKLRLLDTKTKLEISVNDLSDGEKVLMSLALAIYNTEQGGVKPDLLLLDEPDAPLHPSFSKLLIDTLIETIVKKAGVNVIMTSHSPSTVAMAPEGSVFEIDRDSKIPKPVSNNYAIKVLTKGIDFLRVAYENRRQIFVESKYDVEYFEHLYEILKEDNCFSFSPVFLEPHSGSSNCTDVINIVNKLTDAGSDLAFGIIDFDGKNKSKDKVFVLGDAQRYAIENYILDPIYVALALIRENKKHFSDFGITTKKSYISASDLSQDECQLLVNNFLSQIGTKISGDNLKPVSLKNGFVVNYPESFLLQQGHDYENSIKEKFAELKAIAKGQGDSALKKAILKNTIRDFPKFLPIELEETFRKILG